MDLNSIGQTLATATADMQIDSPDGFPLFAYVDPETETPKLTVDVKSLEAKGITPMPCIFKMVGKDSAAFRKRQAQLFKVFQKRKKLNFNEVQEEQTKTVAAAITGWENMVWNDSPNDPASESYFIEFSDENLVKVLTGYAPAKEQADAWIEDRGNVYTSA